MGRLGEDQLGDARASFQFDWMVNLQQPLAPSFIARVPHRRIQHTGVPQQRRPGVEEADVALRDDHAVAVLDDVAAHVERVDVVLGLDLAPVTHSLALPADTAGVDLFVHRTQPKVDTVWLNLCASEVVEALGHELPALEHTVAGTATAKTLLFEP